MRRDMMLQRVGLVRLWLLFLIGGILPYWAHAPRPSCPTVATRTSIRHYADLPSRYASCSERYSCEKRIWVGFSAYVYKARDMKNNANSPVIIKAFTSRAKFDEEATAFDRIAARRRIYEAGRAESAEASARGADASPWNLFAQLLDRCLLNGKSALVIEALDEVLSETIQLRPMTMRPPEKSSEGLDAPDFACGLSPQESMIYGPAINFKWYTYQLLVAVDVLQKAGLTHFDVKPENIGLTHDATLKLFDFEHLASFVPQKYVGTIEYSAPEMNVGWTFARGDKMDVWSVGCTIFEMFTGGVLFPEIRAFAKINRRPSRCFVRAAYFYIMWSFGVSTFDRYGAAEALAREQCPQIFGDKSRELLRTTSPRVFAVAFPPEVRDSGRQGYVDTEIMHQFEHFQREYKTRFMHRNPKDLSLFLDMIDLNDTGRRSAYYMHTKHPMFKEFRN